MVFKKCFPTSTLLNSHCQTVPDIAMKKGRSSTWKKKYVVVYLPCLGRQVKYQTDEEAWHTMSFLLISKTPKVNGRTSDLSQS